jgi:hypothetical protein
VLPWEPRVSIRYRSIGLRNGSPPANGTRSDLRHHPHREHQGTARVRRRSTVASAGAPARVVPGQGSRMSLLTQNG